jgi:hypothetical protein
MGHWIRRLCSHRTSDNNLGLRALLLSLYTSSGRGKVCREAVRSDKKKDTPAVYAPAFSLYGDTTPDIFYSALDEEQLDQGLVSRFLVVECESDKDCMYNELHDQITPDINLITKLDGLISRCHKQLKVDDVIVDVDMTPDASEYLKTFREECDAKRLAEPNGTESIVYSRAHERLLRLSALVAVGISPDYPVVTMDVAMWAKKLIVRTMASVILRFEQGDIGEANLWIYQMKTLKKIIRDYWTAGYKESHLSSHNINQEMYQWKLITHGYINNRIRSFASFRKSRNTPLDLNNCINDLIRNGVLVRIDMGKVRESLRTGVAYYINDLSLLED